MPFKVAVASTDGKVINQHFGRSQEFLIFALNGGNFEFIEIRKNTPPCGSGENHENQMSKTVEALADCKVVLVSQIGPAAVQALNSKGIKVFVLPNYIDEALKTLALSSIVQDYAKK